MAVKLYLWDSHSRACLTLLCSAPPTPCLARCVVGEGAALAPYAAFPVLTEVNLCLWLQQTGQVYSAGQRALGWT